MTRRSFRGASRVGRSASISRHRRSAVVQRCATRWCRRPQRMGAGAGAIGVVRGRNGNLDRCRRAGPQRPRAGRPSIVSGNKAFVLAASARVAHRLGDARRFTEYVAGAQLEWPRLTTATPWLSALTLLELARVHVASGDSAGARTVLRELHDLLRQRPDLGIVGDRARAAGRSDPELPINAAGATALTPAELRLLPLLPTHLTFPEIAARLFLSRHTIKTQAISIYRKLDVASRGAAVTRARETRPARRIRQRRTDRLEPVSAVAELPGAAKSGLRTCRPQDRPIGERLSGVVAPLRAIARTSRALRARSRSFRRRDPRAFRPRSRQSNGRMRRVRRSPSASPRPGARVDAAGRVGGAPARVARAQRSRGSSPGGSRRPSGRAAHMTVRRGHAER